MHRTPVVKEEPDEHTVSPDSTSASKQDSAHQPFSLPERYARTPSVPRKRTHRESLGNSTSLKLTEGLEQDIDDIVQHIGLWSSKAEFYRDAIRRYRNRWIDEARRIKRQLEGNNTGETGGRD